MLHVILFFTACTQGEEAPATTLHEDTAVNFSPYIGKVPESRAGAPGEIDQTGLQTLGFGVFAQHTSNTEWASYTDKSTTPFNFMWNQQVTWDGTSAWTYSPVKYWPNDNNPADDQGATGSQDHSYLSFFAYAPYVSAAELPSTGREDVAADGIVEISKNDAYTDASYIYYRTDKEKPFDKEESVDLLWATNKDLFKMKDSKEGYLDGRVNMVFKHTLAKLLVNVKTLVDRRL